MRWISKETETPQDTERVIGWHRLSGSMPMYGTEVRHNPFVSHFARIGKMGWTDRRDALPTEKDADHTGCVLAATRSGEIRAARWEFVRSDTEFAKWRQLPGKPEG